MTDPNRASLRRLLDERAKSLLGGQSGVAIRTEGLGVKVEGGELQVGADKDMNLVLLVPWSGDTSLPGSAAGVSIDRVSLAPEPGGDPTEWLVLTCRQMHLTATFLDLAAALVADVKEHPDGAADRCIRGYLRWRELFSPPKRTPSDSALTGVLGELQVLVALVRRFGPAALRFWLGPDHGRHDFVVGGEHLEVKSSMANELHTCTIHGLDQLAVLAGETLHLAAFRFERSENGATIREVFDGLVSAGVDPLRLRELVQLAGVDIETPECDIRFAPVEQRMFEVDGGFPSVTRASFVGGELPAGVSMIRYTIDLPSGGQYLDAAASWVESLGEVPDGA